MRTYKEITIPARTELRLTKIVCGCGAERDPRLASGWANRPSHEHNMDEITVQREVGSQYPEYLKTMVTKYDLCPSCWLKLEQFLQSELNATPETETHED